jgi:hypothetical protein
LPATIVVWAAQEAKIMLKGDLIKLMGGLINSSHLILENF